ncbi:MAG TPA: 50S ribosomal protein L11 methyltransferase [Acidimicrobiales bacterium]|nr:50S ribosomal protein L11 methyltransferase [Acidimicrobiales bacterium]
MGVGAATVQVTVPVAEAELAADALWRAGAAAVEEREGRRAAGQVGGRTVVLVAGPREGATVAALVEGTIGRWPTEVVPVDLGAALDGWRPHARAVTVGPIVVRPPWVPQPVRPGTRADVVVDPGRSFGTGVHASTRLALAALAEVVRGGERVLDLGCGSGVLGLTALLLGSASVVAVDVDPAAVTATVANAARNGVADRLVALRADTAGGGRAAGAGGTVPRLVGDGSCDVVAANMLLPELVAVVPMAARAVAPGGVVVASGVLEGQVDALAAAAAASGLAVRPPLPRGDGWAAVTFGLSAATPGRRIGVGGSRAAGHPGPSRWMPPSSEST